MLGILTEHSQKKVRIFSKSKIIKIDPRNTRRDSNENLIIDNFNTEFEDFDYQKEFDEMVKKG